MAGVSGGLRPYRSSADISGFQLDTPATRNHAGGGLSMEPQ